MKYFSLLLFTALAFSSCKKDDVAEEPCSGTVNIETRATWEGAPLVIGDTYTNSFGHPIRVEMFKSYITGIKAISADGSAVSISDAELVNFANANTWSVSLPAGNYTGLRFAIGVPADINTGTDPASYPNDSPLSISGAQGMFWTWNSGYIFVKFEGKTAFDAEATILNQPYAFHIGTDNFYAEHEYAVDFTVGESAVNLDIVFEAEKFLNGTDDTINLQTDYITHTTDNLPLAGRFMDLYNAAISVSK
jgi:hypothetical protein